MPRILFTFDPKLPRDWVHLGYRKGTEIELSPDQCERWIRRGCAIYATAPEPIAEPVVAAPVEAPAEVAAPSAFEARKAEQKKVWRRK